MLYSFAHFLRERFVWIWELAEGINSFLFKMRYRSRLKMLPEVLSHYENVRLATIDDVKPLAVFFGRQREEDFAYFHPHEFDEETLGLLINRTSFIVGIVEMNGGIAGYFFLRSFVHGQCYLGKMVDHDLQGRGIGKLMCKAAMDIASTLGIRMFESINKENMASMRSSGSVLKQVVLKELDHGDLLIEDLPLSEIPNIK